MEKKTIIITMDGGDINTQSNGFANPIEILGALRFAEWQLLDTWKDLITLNHADADITEV